MPENILLSDLKLLPLPFREGKVSLSELGWVLMGRDGFRDAKKPRIKI